MANKKNSALEPAAAKPSVVAEQPVTASYGNPPFITEFKSSCAPRHAARSRGIQKTTAERFKPEEAGLRARGPFIHPRAIPKPARMSDRSRPALQRQAPMAHWVVVPVVIPAEAGMPVLSIVVLGIPKSHNHERQAVPIRRFSYQSSAFLVLRGCISRNKRLFFSY